MRLSPFALLALEAFRATRALRFRNAQHAAATTPLNSVTSSPTPRRAQKLRFRAASPQEALPSVTISMPGGDVPSALPSMSEKLNSIASSMSADAPRPTVPAFPWDSEPSTLSPPTSETSSAVLSAPSGPPEPPASSAAAATPTPTLSASSSQSAGPNNTGAIVGGVVGGLAVVAIAVCVVAWMFLRKRRDAKHARTPAAEMEAAEKMAGPYAEEEKRDYKSQAVLAEAPANEVYEAPGDNALGTRGNAAELSGRRSG